MSDLQKHLRRLADTHAGLRPHLLPLLKGAGQNDPNYWYGLEPRHPAMDEPAPIPKTALAPTTDPTRWKVFNESPRRWSWTDSRTSFMVTELEGPGYPLYRLVMRTKVDGESVGPLRYTGKNLKKPEEAFAVAKLWHTKLDRLNMAIGGGIDFTGDWAAAGARLASTKASAWENLPNGWTQDSVQSMWDTMTGDVKHKITKCMKTMAGKVDDAGAFCGSLATQVGYEKTAEWKGWAEDMPVQVATDGRTEVFSNLAAARQKYPELNPERGSSRFTWAMRGQVGGKDAIRFESHDVYRSLSRDASLLRKAMIRVARDHVAARPLLLPHLRIK